ncbi:eugenol synthase 1-like [Euphorbia lathyris]|uniref:eugenol synthase 1-like n=1 Tax=Euphorbia lathyris TaxID=212925 RepID=UPI003313C695
MENNKVKSKILIFGASGYLGKYMVKASILLGHQTYAYSRPISSVSSASKIDTLHHFQSMGVTVVHGELNEHEKIVHLLGQIDVVISVLPLPLVLHQFYIIAAIKAAANIKRFIPSDFGIEEDKIIPLQPLEDGLENKRKIRRAVEEAGIPHTFVSVSAFAAYFVNHLLHPHQQTNSDITVYGTGNAKVVMNYEEDVAMYTIKAADDPKTFNRLLNIRPEKNIISQLQLIHLWEKKTSRTFNNLHIPHKQMLHLSLSLPYPENIKTAILESLFAKGDTMSYELEKNDLEASQLYPDYEYTSIDQLLDIFLVHPPSPSSAAF